MHIFTKTIAAIMFTVAVIIVAGCNKSDELNNVSGSFNGHDYVDLGLPSGTLWATCNVGADVPECYGDYFAWGETEAKSVYSLETYKYEDSIPYSDHTGAEFLRANDDAASVNWGGNWRTPTYGEWCELCQYTTFEEVKMNGVKGVCFNGTNGNSIYLPYAGFCVGDEIKEEGISGGYWKSTVWGGAESQMFLYINCSFNMGVEAYGPAYYGRSVRPVHSTER